MDNTNSYTYRKYDNNKLKYELLTIGLLISILLLLQLSIKLSASFKLFILIGALVILRIGEIVISDFKRHNYLTWGRGAGGEWTIGKVLEKLPDSYELLSDYNTGRGNIDHLCIGETGIFAIEVKASTGIVSSQGEELLLNGQVQIDDYLVQTRAEVLYIQKLLKEKTGKDYTVDGMLIFSKAKVKIRRPISGIWIGGRDFCNWHILQKSITIPYEEINKIVDILVNSEKK